MSLSKKIMTTIGAVALSTSAMAASATYSCTDKNGSMRQHGDSHPAKASLVLHVNESKESGLTVVARGEIGVEYDFDGTGATTSKIKEFEYYGAFKNVELAQNLNYKPRKYKNHVQFRDLDATSGSEGMWGNLVVSKEIFPSFKPPLPVTASAHYIFQAGDHMGGTLDLTCTRIVKHIQPLR